MTRYEYKVVPAPTSGVKAKGLKTNTARFANALEVLMNELGAEGWTYVRADTLPCEERSGLTGRVTKYQNMLVFQRAVAVAEAPQIAGLLSAPAVEPPNPRAAAPGAATQGTPPTLGPATGAASTDAAPPVSRPDAPDTSAAARAAAEALRPFRSQSQGTAEHREPTRPPLSARRGSDFAAE